MNTTLSKGFSLIELIVAVSLLAIIVLVSMNFLSQQSSIMVKGQLDENVSQTFFAINQAVSQYEGCVETFVKPGTVRPENAGTEVDKIFFRAGAPAFQKNSPIGQSGASHAISISSMVLQNFAYGATHHGLAEFLVKLKTKDKKVHEQKFLVNVIVKNGIVTECINKNEPVLDCRGEWSNCTVTCGGGTQTYSIIAEEKNGGASCTHTNNEVRTCNTNSCHAWVTSEWGTCSGGTGSWTYGPWGACEGGRAVYSSACGSCVGYVGLDENCAVETDFACSSVCTWTGTRTRTATCNHTSNTGTQTRTVNCQKEGVVTADSMCSGTKPSTSQSCTSTNDNSCGFKQPTTSDCPSTITPNPCST